MTRLRSFLFTLYFLLMSAALSVISLPLLLAPKYTIGLIVKAWGKATLFGFGHIIGVRQVFRHIERIPPPPCILACQHQSAWETAALHVAVDKPVYVLKKELMYLPLYGLYLRALGCVAVDRGAGAKALKSMVKGVKETLDRKRYVIIFPHGTRTAPGETPEMKPGILAVYNALPADSGVTVCPVTLDSGRCWPKKGMKRKGVITMEFHPAIPAGLKRKEFETRLKDVLGG